MDVGDGDGGMPKEVRSGKVLYCSPTSTGTGIDDRIRVDY